MEDNAPTLATRTNELLDAHLRPEEIDELLSPEDTARMRKKGTSKPRERARTGNRNEKRGRASEKYKQLSFWVTREEYFALRNASLTREQEGESPYKHEHMTKDAFRSYLQRLGYLAKKVA